MDGIFSSKTKQFRMFLMVFTSMVMLVLCSCSRTSNPERHAVSSEEIRKAMKELDYFLSKDISDKLYMEMPTPSDMSKVKSTAEEMAKTAAHIPEAINKLNLNETERAEFLKLAENLRDQALELSTHASNKDLPQAKLTMGRIEKTCNACHGSFRIQPERPVNTD